MAAEHGQHPQWGAYAQRIASGELWQRPRGGGHDDHAHPPIHPTKVNMGPLPSTKIFQSSASQGSAHRTTHTHQIPPHQKASAGEADWSPDKRRLYEFVVRSFLAACSKPAIGYETRVTATVAAEAFVATGACVVQA